MNLCRSWTDSEDFSRPEGPIVVKKIEKILYDFQGTETNYTRDLIASMFNTNSEEKITNTYHHS